MKPVKNVRFILLLRVLQSEGYDVEYIAEMNLVDAIKRLLSGKNYIICMR